MALSNYNELKLSIIKWSHRSDLDKLVDDFIELAETEMFANNIEILQLRGMETRSTASTGANQFLALPDDFKSMRSVRLLVDDHNGSLRFKTPEALVRRGGTGRPSYFAVSTQLEFDVTPDQTYTVEMNYIRKPTPLSASNATNVVLDNSANIYLFGSLWALFTHADDEQQAQKYYQRFIGAIQGSNQADEDGRYGPAPYGRIQGPTP